MATIKTVGKSKIEFSIRGCIDCGTEHSFAWEVARVIKIQIGNKIYHGEVYRCGDCIKKRGVTLKRLVI